MDPTSTVRTDALPAIATLVIPGAFGGIPYAWFILDSVPQLRIYLDAHDGIAALTAVLVAIAIGFTIESAGSYAEVHLIDRRRADHNRMLETWWRYLRIAWVKEPIGQQYLRRLLVTFKFELNMFVAALFASLGVLLLAVTGRLQFTTGLGVLVGMIVAASLFFGAARGSANVLAEVRQRLVSGVGEPPFDEMGNPKKA
jgi:hypothetical protein